MRHIRLWLAFIGLLVLVSFLAPAQRSQALTKENRKRASLATVKILTLDAQGDQIGTCTGTMIDDVGYILTNWHCIGHTDLYGPDESGLKHGDTYHPQGMVVIAPTKDPRQIPVPTYLAQLLSGDPKLDVAVLKITGMFNEQERLPNRIPVVPITLGDSDEIEPLDYVAVIGYPGVGGPRLTLTDGKISGYDDQDNDGEDDSFKTDAEISPGNSGGLAINDNGEQIGIPTAINVRNGGKISAIKMVNVAVPVIDEARTLGGLEVGAPEQVPQQPNVPTPPTTGGGAFGTPTFGTQMNDGVLDDPGTQFGSGTETVYGVFQFQGMRSGADWGYMFLYNGQEMEGQVKGLRWNLPDKGTAFVELVASSGAALPDGAWSLALYSNGKAVSEGAFTIGSGSAKPPTQPRPPQPDTQGVQLQGQVVDADTKRPISGALFVLLQPGVTPEQWERNKFSDSMVAASGTTDRSGNYITAPAVERGEEYGVVIGAKGYQRVTGSIPIEDGDPALTDMNPIGLQKR